MGLYWDDAKENKWTTTKGFIRVYIETLLG